MIIAGGTAKQLGVLSKKKKLWKKRKRRENFGHWFYCHFGTYLEHFLESILYILYTVSKLGKSGVQFFKRCPNRNWNEKVMVIARKLDRAEREFRTPQSKVRNHLLAHECHFAHLKAIFTRCESRCEKFRTPLFKVWNSFQGAKFSIQGANSLNINFAHHNPRCENFRTVRNTLLEHECHFAHPKPIFARCETRCENFAHHNSRCEIQSNVWIRVRKFHYCWMHFWSTSWSSNYVYDMSFWSLGSKESSALNGKLFGFEMKKLWSFEDDYAKLNGNVAAAPNFTTVRHVFGALPGAQIMHTIYNFEA